MQLFAVYDMLTSTLWLLGLLRRMQFDKTVKENTLKDFMQRLEKEKFYASDEIDLLFERVIGLTSKYAPSLSAGRRTDLGCTLTYSRLNLDITETSSRLGTWSAA